MPHVKEGFKIIGYIARDSLGRIGGVGEECIVSGTEELMKTYLRRLGNPEFDKIVIKKIRFNEIMDNLFMGVTYSFDKESYGRFLPLAEMNEMKNLLPAAKFLEESSTGLDFITVKLT